MSMKSYKYILAIASCLSLSTAYSADVEMPTYSPRSSGYGLLKTAIVLGLGTISQVVGTPTQYPTSKPTTPFESFMGFGDCYIGTVDLQKTTDMRSISIDKIKTIPCNFYYDYPLSEFTNISMTLSTTCIPNLYHTGQPREMNRYSFESAIRVPDSPSTSNNCEVININKISMCDNNFNLNYDGQIKWNYRNNNDYSQFSLYIYDNPYIDSDPRLDWKYPVDKYLFDKLFSYFMKTGECPPKPVFTDSPTRPTRFTHMPTPAPTKIKSVVN